MTTDIYKQMLGQTEWLAMKLFAGKYGLSDEIANNLWFEISDETEEDFLMLARIALAALGQKEPAKPAPQPQPKPKPERKRKIVRAPWTDKQVAELVELSAAGKDIVELSEHFKRTQSAIQTALHKIRHQLPIGGMNRGKRK